MSDFPNIEIKPRLEMWLLHWLCRLALHSTWLSWHPQGRNSSNLSKRRKITLTHYQLPTTTNCCLCQPPCDRSNANLSFIYILKRKCQFNIEMFEILNLLELLYRNLWLPFKQKFCTFLLVVTENFKVSVSQSVSSLNLRTV